MVRQDGAAPRSLRIAAALPAAPAGKRAYYRDDSFPTGLRLAITSSGHKSWQLQTRINGRVMRLSLGTYPDVQPPVVKRLADQRRGEVAKGINPNAQKRAEAVRGLTLGDGLDLWLKIRGSKLKASTRDHYSRDIKRDLGDWLNKPIRQINRNMVETRFRKLATKSPAGAQKTMRGLSSVWTWLHHYHEDDEGESAIPPCPVNRLKRIGLWSTPKHRETFIRDHQLPAWFAAVDTLRAEPWQSHGKTVGDLLMFCVLTGARRMEAFTLRWDAVDLNGGLIRFIATKNGKDHVLPVSGDVLTLLQSRWGNRPNGCKYVFWGLDGLSHIKEERPQLRRVVASSGVQFTMHDLRRTFATAAKSVRAPYEVTQALANHTPTSVTLQYVQITEQDLRETMENISDYLLRAGHLKRASITHFQGEIIRDGR